MTEASQLPLEAPASPPPPLPNGVVGMLVFVITESMLFAGLISAFLIVKQSAAIWPPPDQPRLPVEVTALNTLFLLLSGVFVAIAVRRAAKGRDLARRPLFVAIALGVTFVTIQGAEWVALLGEGLTMTSGQLGGFFYLIVGCHALHALGAILAMLWVARRLVRGEMRRAQLQTVALLWGFVVVIWPIVYHEVYL